MGKSRQAGLTFAELLIASLMMSILFIGLGSHLRGGILVWQRATKTSEALQQQRVALERLARDLRGGFVYSQELAYGAAPKLPAPRFEADRARWFTRQSATARQPGQIRLVEYYCGVQGAVQGLWRTTWSISEARTDTFRPTPELLVAGCEALSVRYAYLPPGSVAPSLAMFEWHGQWNEPKQLPQLLEVSMQRAHGGTIRQLFSIPAGMLKPFEQAPASP